MIPLSQRQVAALLKAICQERGCTPQSILHSLPVVVRGNVALTRQHGVYVLLSISAPLPDATVYPYIICIDGAPTFSQSSSYNALVLADKLCMLYTLAREIKVTHGDTVLMRWCRIGVSEWVNKGGLS